MKWDKLKITNDLNPFLVVVILLAVHSFPKEGQYIWSDRKM